MSTASFIAALRRFQHDEDGPTATEYAVLLGLIIVVVLAAVTQLGAQVNGIFENMAGYFPG
jgi:pilus assembly protein Flp/PilA